MGRDGVAERFPNFGRSSLGVRPNIPRTRGAGLRVRLLCGLSLLLAREPHPFLSRGPLGLYVGPARLPLVPFVEGVAAFHAVPKAHLNQSLRLSGRP